MSNQITTSVKGMNVVRIDTHSNAFANKGKSHTLNLENGDFIFCERLASYDTLSHCYELYREIAVNGRLIEITSIQGDERVWISNVWIPEGK